MSLQGIIRYLLVHMCHGVVVFPGLCIDICVIFSFFRGIDQLGPLSNRRLVPSTFSHPDYLPIWVEMGSGIELHYHLIIPFSQLLTNKCVHFIHSEALMNSRKVIFIVINECPVNPSHITHYGLLIQEYCLIEVLMLLSVKPVIHSNPSPCCIWIYLPP